MLVNKLLDNYEFHDSLIENITYTEKEHELVITLDFCFWMQKGYNSNTPETGKAKLKFTDVCHYEGLTGAIDCFSIIDVNQSNDVLVFSVLDDINENYLELHIKANSVDFITTEPYLKL